MNSATVRDMDEISRLKKEIEERQDRLRAIRSACQHLDHRPALVETLAFDLTPVRQCPVCEATVAGITDEEKTALWRELFSDMEWELTEERLSEVKNGMNWFRREFEPKNRSGASGGSAG